LRGGSSGRAALAANVTETKRCARHAGGTKPGPDAFTRRLARRFPASALERQETDMRKILAIFALSTSLALAACNTVEGVGEDVQSAGEAVEDAAD
jgi:predicted small secreted protein